MDKHFSILFILIIVVVAFLIFSSSARSTMLEMGKMVVAFVIMIGAIVGLMALTGSDRK